MHRTQLCFCMKNPGVFLLSRRERNKTMVRPITETRHSCLPDHVSLSADEERTIIDKFNKAELKAAQVSAIENKLFAAKLDSPEWNNIEQLWKLRGIELGTNVAPKWEAPGFQIAYRAGDIVPPHQKSRIDDTTEFTRWGWHSYVYEQGGCSWHTCAGAPILVGSEYSTLAEKLHAGMGDVCSWPHKLGFYRAGIGKLRYPNGAFCFLPGKEPKQAPSKIFGNWLYEVCTNPHASAIVNRSGELPALHTFDGFDGSPYPSVQCDLGNETERPMVYYMGKPVTAPLNKDAYLIPGKSGYVRCSFLRTLKYQHTDLKERYARKSVFAFAPVTTPTEAYVSSNYDGKEEIFKVKIADLQTPGPNKTRTQY